MNTGGVRYKRGLVVATKPGFAQVRFDDIAGLTTHWLPALHPKTQHDQAVWSLDEGTQVACLLDQHFEDGCILGALYSTADPPPVTSTDKFRIQFKDGGSVEYDRSSGAMNVVCKGVVNLTADGAVTIQAPSITLDSPQTTCSGKLTVQGLLTYQNGLSGSGSGNAASIQGNVSVSGNINASGAILDGGGNSNHHSH